MQFSFGQQDETMEVSMGSSVSMDAGFYSKKRERFAEEEEDEQNNEESWEKMPEVILSEKIKKFRISNTPGEIRLQKDLKAMRDKARFPGILLESDSSVVRVTFQEDNSGSIPARFWIAVPRYYPHVCPEVRCIDNLYSSPYIDMSGNVIHPTLSNWSAVQGLGDVIEMLKNIRLTYLTSASEQKFGGGALALAPTFHTETSSSSASKILRSVPLQLPRSYTQPFKIIPSVSEPEEGNMVSDDDDCDDDDDDDDDDEKSDSYTRSYVSPSFRMKDAGIRRMSPVCHDPYGSSSLPSVIPFFCVDALSMDIENRLDQVLETMSHK